MQITALLVRMLFTLGLTQEVPASSEPAPLLEANPDGSVSYLWTHKQDMTYSALQTKWLCCCSPCALLFYVLVSLTLGIVVR